ncbi:anti-sigma factor family protein [Massilia consociata]|uniref:Anti-sigma factor family protein n=1 Tax=Massilia consociata TaxID=760117 RepID=A0ABV6FKA1_9BURK
MKFSDDLLIAYINGELAEPARAAVERAMNADPVLAARIAQHRREHAGLGRSRMFSVSANGHDGASHSQRHAPTPGAKVVHLDAIRPGRAFPPPQPPRQDPGWTRRHWLAVAAALVAGAVGGALGWQQMRPDAGVVTLMASDGALVARGKLVEALGGQLASPGPSETGVRIGVTFVSKDGSYCRSFVVDTTAGLACRAGGRWTIPVLAQARPGAAWLDGSVLPPAVQAAIDARIVGATLDPTAERAAQQRGWKP